MNLKKYGGCVMPTDRAIIAEAFRVRKPLFAAGAQYATYRAASGAALAPELGELAQQNLFDKFAAADVTRLGELIERIHGFAVEL